MAWEPDRMSNFFFIPPANLCAVTYMTEISLIVTLNNQFNSTQLGGKEYCKTLIIRVTLFSRGHRPWYIHETLFSRIFMSSSITLILEIISKGFIFASVCSRELTRK